MSESEMSDETAGASVGCMIAGVQALFYSSPCTLGFLLIVLFNGEPDLVDGIVHWLMKQ